MRADLVPVRSPKSSALKAGLPLKPCRNTYSTTAGICSQRVISRLKHDCAVLAERFGGCDANCNYSGSIRLWLPQRRKFSISASDGFHQPVEIFNFRVIRHVNCRLTQLVKTRPLISTRIFIFCVIAVCRR